MRNSHEKKRLSKAICTLGFLLFFFPLTLEAGQMPTPAMAGIYNETGIPGMENMDVQDFLQLTPKNLKESGIEMSLRDRLVLRQVQYQVRRKLKKGEDFNLQELYKLEDGGFSFGGFLLGFFLGLIGLLIAILFGRNAVRSALYGMICNALILLIAIAAGS